MKLQIKFGHGLLKSIMHRMPSFFRFLVASTLLLLLGMQSCMGEVLGSQIKTAYVLNFVKFTEWPAGVATTGVVTLCAVGNNVLDGTLATLDGRKAGGRELRVVHYSPETLFAERVNASSSLGNCQVVFFGTSERHRYKPLLDSLADFSVLTISDIDDFAESGGGIGLGYRENKIIFEVNLAAVQRSKLHLPGQLLNLASYIYKR